MKTNIQNAIKETYKKAGQIANLMMDEKTSFDKNRELRAAKDKCFKKIAFYKNLNKALQTVK